MELDHEFTVPVPIEHAWAVLLDVERVAPCMPGATLDSIDGDEFSGRLKVKLGAMTITYKGTARIASKDEASRTVTMEGLGKESRGAGTAAATVQAHLHDEGDTTRVSVHTKLNVTGRPAQFGRNILSEVGGKLIGRFADALHQEIQRPDNQGTGKAPERPAPASAQQRPATATATDGGAANATGVDTTGVDTTGMDTTGNGPRRAAARQQGHASDAIDLLEVAGPAVARRAAPVAAGFVAVFTIWRVFRRRRGRHRSS
jgi:carbon monoxide dehydrogenase subunit G